MVLHGWVGRVEEYGDITVVFLPCFSCRFVFVLLSFFLLYLLLSFISCFLSLSSIVWPHHNQSICTRPHIVLFAVENMQFLLRRITVVRSTCSIVRVVSLVKFASVAIVHSTVWVVGGPGQATESK